MAKFGSKQPYEEYYVAFDFTNVIGSSTIASADVVVYDSTGATATSSITEVANQNISSPDVNVWVKGGVDGEDYKITVKITTSSAPQEHYEMDVTLPVAEL